MARLSPRLARLAEQRPEGSNTARLLDDPRLLDAKLFEELGELTAADADVTAEAADLLYFALVKSVAAGVTLEDIERLLDLRERAVTRRPMTMKEAD